MRLASLVVLEILTAGVALAHSYRAGAIEIIHPAIMVPETGAGGTCADATIINHGTETDFLFKAEVAVAAMTQLVHLSGNTRSVSVPPGVAIAPGAALDLHDNHLCIFLNGITASLEVDVGLYAGTLFFRHAGPIAVEFMVDGSHS